MTARQGRGRPALDDVDLSDMTGPFRQPSQDEIERRRALGSSLETPAFLELSSSAGMVRVVRSSAQSSTVKAADSQLALPGGSETPPAHALPEPGAAAQGRRSRAEEPNLTVRLPEYVQQAVRMRAVAEKTTMRLVILRALRAAGFEIEACDMTDDRGIVAKRRARDRKP